MTGDASRGWSTSRRKAEVAPFMSTTSVEASKTASATSATSPSTSSKTKWPKPTPSYGSTKTSSPTSLKGSGRALKTSTLTRMNSSLDSKTSLLRWTTRSVAWSPWPPRGSCRSTRCASSPTSIGCKGCGSRNSCLRPTIGSSWAQR
ncbi:hypothetical protein AS25_11325 [Kocuria marina]|uniref:Uncharacterized protein n=1 Tax=Kocuria marina TaxID=223184 RepID=A0A0B0DEN1_9MICC|nr:hypothetical protein AS25_11325 [Kocuria marina]